MPVVPKMTVLKKWPFSPYDSAFFQNLTISVKSSSEEKGTFFEFELSHLRTLQALADDPPSLQFCRPLICELHFLPKSHSCTLRGRGIPCSRLVLRQFTLTHLVNFLPT